MLDLYVENLRQKEIDERDVRLLQVTGLEEMIDILKAKAEYERGRNLNADTTFEMEQRLWKEGVNIST